MSLKTLTLSIFSPSSASSASNFLVISSLVIKNHTDEGNPQRGFAPLKKDLLETDKGDVLEDQPALSSCGSRSLFSDQHHHPLHGLVRIFFRETRKNVIHYRPFLGGKMELQPKSVIFTTILLSTTQLVDFRRPWTSVLLECRYDIPCNFTDNRETDRTLFSFLII